MFNSRRGSIANHANHPTSYLGRIEGDFGGLIGRGHREFRSIWHRQVMVLFLFLGLMSSPTFALFDEPSATDETSKGFRGVHPPAGEAVLPGVPLDGGAGGRPGPRTVHQAGPRAERASGLAAGRRDARQRRDAPEGGPPARPTPNGPGSARWVRGYLATEASRRAGDPGRVVLRRLNNAEYTYTLRDLTGVDSLEPAREFPVDGAAGEGFTNTGNALVMSPSLVTKYLDAAKEVAGHAVLLPDGFRFSPGTTPRDWTEETLAKIRDFYREFTDPRGRRQGQPPGHRLRHQPGRAPAPGKIPRRDDRRARGLDLGRRRPSRPWLANAG